MLDAFKIEIAQSINCVLIGRIEDYSAAKNTASVSIQEQRRYMNGATLDFPLLTDCPVFVLNGGGSFLNMPISSGDTCIVLFNDRDIDAWHHSGGVEIPQSLRTHSLSDGMVIVGVQNTKNVLALDDAMVELHGGPNPVQITSEEDITLTTDSNTVVNTTKLTVSATTGGIANKMTTGKLSVKNTTADLATLVNAFITAVAACNVGTLNSGVFATNINAFKSQFAALLEAGS